MSTYPPPGAPGSPYPTNTREALKAQRQAMKMQRRAMKYQARLQRAQLRMQRRALRRRSIVGPLVLILLGVLFLLAQAGRLSWGRLLDWYAHWWPLVLIAAGLILLTEWAVDHARRDAEGRPLGVRTLGGGVVLLLIFMGAIGICLRYSDAAVLWKEHWLGPGWTGLAELTGDEHDSDSSTERSIAPNASLLVRNPHGDVTVTGTSDDGLIHLSAHKQVWAWKQSDATAREQQLEPVFTGDASRLTVMVGDVSGGQADITVEVPEGVTVTVNASRGDVNVSNLRANVELTANHGDVNVSDIGGTVTAHTNNDDASVTAHDIMGGLTLQGHAGDITVSDIGGPVALQGDFFGTTHAERLSDSLRFETSRTHFECARVDGSFEISGGSSSDLEAHELLGPVVVKTRNRNITLDRVQGRVEVTNRNGDVNVTQTRPLAPLKVDNARGSVTVGLPEGQGFVLSATTQHGDLENDYGLNQSQSGDQKSLQGTIDSGGPSISLTTTEGDITVQKSTVDPLPPPAPRPAPKPRPAAPAKPPKAPEPASPSGPSAPAAPGSPGPAPKAPSSPKPPVSVNF